MRTRLDIDHDILLAAKDLARRERTGAGALVSRLARHSPSGRSPPQLAVPRVDRQPLGSLDRRIPVGIVHGARAHHLVVLE